MIYLMQSSSDTYWNIQINMMELAKRIYRMTPEQSAEFQNIILNNRTDDMRLAAEEGM